MNGRLEKKLVARCRKADKLSYAGLVKAYSRRVFAICLGMLGNNHDAEDIAQQVLLKGFTDINQLRDDEQFGAWISRIARNLCIDFIRRRKLEANGLVEQAATSRSDSKEYPGLEAALAKLSEDYRLALMLYYFDGRSAESVAETLGISKAVVYTRLSRARKQLRKLLDAEGCE